MTHKELVGLAKKWLIKKRCSIVVTEMYSCRESPDAICQQLLKKLPEQTGACRMPLSATADIK